MVSGSSTTPIVEGPQCLRCLRGILEPYASPGTKTSCIYIYIYTYIYIYIFYINVLTCIYIYVYVSIYIYIYMMYTHTHAYDLSVLHGLRVFRFENNGD